MTKLELTKVKGGASAAVINAVARVINSILSIGQMIGSAIKRKLLGLTNQC